MDVGGKDEMDQVKGDEDIMSYHSPNVSSDWRFGGPNLTNPLTGSIPTANLMTVCSKGGLMESSSSSSAPIMDSFSHAVWDHPTSTSQNLAFCDINLQNSATTSNITMDIRKGPLAPLGVDRTVDVGWAPPNSMVKGGGVFLPNAHGMLLPQSLSQFPADSGFIERAARFSCFGRGNFGDLVNSCSASESMNLYSRSGPVIMQQPLEVFGGNGLNSDVKMNESSKGIPLSTEQGAATEGSPLKNERRSYISGNGSDEAENSGADGQDDPCSSKPIGLNKRKRGGGGGQDNEIGQNETLQPTGEATKDNTEIEAKGDLTPTSTSYKPSGKHGKQGPRPSDSQKEEYIHIRARRGQATNSHSLAERVRREKISERMKYLQDLVPGCSKIRVKDCSDISQEKCIPSTFNPPSSAVSQVTGKAVMLDEIINYVQSLQRQVEFLSMKLATVNPRLDSNLEGFLTKDILQSRAGPSSTLGYSHDMTHMTMPFTPLHPSQPGVPVMANSSDALRRSINTQLAAMSEGYQEPSSQVPNMWGQDELHNVVQMGFNSSAPLDSQELNGMTD